MNDSADVATDRPIVSIVIVTYNSSAVIDACLSSLNPAENRDFEVILVDNSSSDDTVTSVRGRYPKVRVLENASNEGFAVAVNQGAAIATGKFISLLNPDAVLTAQALRLLVDYHKTRERSCITAPLIVHPDGRLRIVSAGRFPSAWRMFCHYFGLSRVVRSRFFQGHYLLPSSLKRVESVDWVTGAVLVVSTSDWLHLRGLSERWFMYAEDIEFCWRAKALGIDILLITDVRATHLVGASTGEPRAMKADWVVNLYDFYRTSMGSGPLGRRLWKLIVAAGLISRSMIYRLQDLRGKEAESAGYWRYESYRFLFFARELLRSR